MLKKIIRSTVILGLLAGLAGAGAYWAITYFITHEKPVRIPDLTGQDVIAVLQILTDLDLNTKIQGIEFSSTHAKNRIMGQDPPPGTEIKRGRDVRIIISQGPQSFAVPDLVGLSLEEAQSVLASQDLCIGNTARTREPHKGRNEILAQAPNPGMVTARNACVDLLINAGVSGELYLMPNFTGQDISQSLAQMAQLRVKSHTIAYIYDDQQPANRVLSQEPAAGTPISHRQTINLVVNHPQANDTVPTATDRSASYLIRHRLPPGFLKQRIRIHWRTSALNEDLFDEFISPGQEIWVLVPRFQNAIVELFESESKIETRNLRVHYAP